VCDIAATATAPSEDPVSATGSPTGGATGRIRCSLAAELSNGSSTTIQLVFDVVDIEHVAVSREISK